MTRKDIIGLVLAALLLVYVGGYAVCRSGNLLVHTACVLNVDSHGRYHVIHTRSHDALAGHAVEILFWPLREIEATWHGRGGRLD